MKRADSILFTGAGFSRGAKNRSGVDMPLGKDLRPLLWNLCYPGEPFADVSRLEDLFEVAKSRNRKGLTELLHAQLGVDTESIPDYYPMLFGLPWYRCYTLNVDDLSDAVQRKFPMQRELKSISAISWHQRSHADSLASTLEIIHLNGILSEAPDQVTFSPTQYAERLAGQEPLYALCAADVLSRPVIFIGTPVPNPSPKRGGEAGPSREVSLTRSQMRQKLEKNSDKI